MESQQLRRETETVGPTEELIYWRRLLVRFSSIVEQMKDPHIQMFIQLLIQARSTLVKVWCYKQPYFRILIYTLPLVSGFVHWQSSGRVIFCINNKSLLYRTAKNSTWRFFLDLFCRNGKNWMVMSQQYRYCHKRMWNICMHWKNILNHYTDWTQPE